MKIAISVPNPVFQAGEHLAQQLKLSRSQLYSDALAAYLSSRGAREVTARLNTVHGATQSTLDSSLARAQGEALGDEAW
jgi:DNA-binding transcriptional MocR family regulator